MHGCEFWHSQLTMFQALATIGTLVATRAQAAFSVKRKLALDLDDIELKCFDAADVISCCLL
jgi:glycine cleavage system regulatory protein